MRCARVLDRCAQQADRIGKIGIQRSVVLDHRGDGGVADHRRSQFTQAVAPATAPLEQAQRDRGIEQAARRFGATGRVVRQRLAQPSAALRPTYRTAAIARRPAEPANRRSRRTRSNSSRAWRRATGRVSANAAARRWNKGFASSRSRQARQLVDPTPTTAPSRRLALQACHRGRCSDCGSVDSLSGSATSSSDSVPWDQPFGFHPHQAAQCLGTGAVGHGGHRTADQLIEVRDRAVESQFAGRVRTQQRDVAADRLAHHPRVTDHVADVVGRLIGLAQPLAECTPGCGRRTGRLRAGLGRPRQTTRRSWRAGSRSTTPAARTPRPARRRCRPACPRRRQSWPSAAPAAAGTGRRPPPPSGTPARSARHLPAPPGFRR